jgi:hypothetical protein
MTDTSSSKDYSVHESGSTPVDTTLKEILEMSFPYVDEFLSGMHKREPLDSA